MTWQGIKEICGLTKGKDNLQGKYATWRLLRNTVLANLVNQAFQAVTETIDRKWYIHCNKISTSFSSRSLHHWCPEGRKTNSENQYQESCRAWCYTQLAPQGCQCLQVCGMPASEMGTEVSWCSYPSKSHSTNNGSQRSWTHLTYSSFMKHFQNLPTKYCLPTFQ